MSSPRFSQTFLPFSISSLDRPSPPRSPFRQTPTSSAGFTKHYGDALDSSRDPSIKSIGVSSSHHQGFQLDTLKAEFVSHFPTSHSSSPKEFIQQGSSTCLSHEKVGNVNLTKSLDTLPTTSQVALHDFHSSSTYEHSHPDLGYRESLSGEDYTGTYLDKNRASYRQHSASSSSSSTHQVCARCPLVHAHDSDHRE